MRLSLCAFLIAAVLIAAAPTGTVRVLSAVGMREVLLDLGPKFERASGHTLNLVFESSGIIARRVEGGEAVDVVLINQAGIDRLTKAGRLVKGSSAALATSIVGVAVRTGAAKPDISTTTAFRAAMLGASRIAVPDPALDGSSGVHIANVFERLGLSASIKPKIIYADPPGPGAAYPGSIVADGRAEIALHQMHELSAVKGITVVGPLPGELQQTFVFSGAITTSATDGAGARAFIEFILTPESRALITAKGMGLPPR